MVAETGLQLLVRKEGMYGKALPNADVLMHPLSPSVLRNVRFFLVFTTQECSKVASVGRNVLSKMFTVQTNTECVGGGTGALVAGMISSLQNTFLVHINNVQRGHLLEHEINMVRMFFSAPNSGNFNYGADSSLLQDA